MVQSIFAGCNGKVNLLASGRDDLVRGIAVSVSTVAVAWLLGALVIFTGLGRLPLILPDEGRNAEVAREMRLTGNWLVPTYNGLPYLDKPAFFFKTVALSLALFGETETAARLPSALSGFALLALTFAFVRREYGTRTGALAMMVVATAPLYLAFCRLVIFDMMLALFVCGAIFAGYIAEQKQGRARTGWYLLGAACSALATLVKGPVGFVVPVLVLTTFNILDRRRGAWKRLFAPWNVLVFFALTLPWFLGLCHQRPDFAYYGLVEESFRRYTTSAFHRPGPFYFYVPWVLIALFPWSVLLPESIFAAWRTRRQWKSADRLFIVWAVVVIVFFSLSKSKRPDYILSAVVALGALTARVLTLALETTGGLPARLLRRATLALVVLCVAGAVGLWTRAIPLAVALLACAAVAGVVWWRRNSPAAIALFVAVLLVVLTAGFGLIRMYATVKSARALADRMPPLPAGTELACLDCFPTGLPFYRKQFVNVITDTGDEFTSNYIIFMLKKTSPWPPGVIPLAIRDRWLAARRQPVFLMAYHRASEDLESIATANSATVTNFFHGWWGVLLPAPGAR